jgi:hypothetical protein
MGLTTRARRIAAATTTTIAAAGLAIGVATLAQAAPGSSTAAPRTVTCQTAGLVVWLNTNGNGTAGTIFYHLNFTNLSGHTCTLQGFPFVNAVNLSNNPVGNPARFNKHFTAHVVTLGKGKTVSALLGIGDVGHFAPSACHPVTAAGLRVFPPTGVSAGFKIVPFPFRACSTVGAHAPKFMIVRPVVQ